MAQTFVQIGNSHGVIISKDLMKEVGVNPKQQIWVEADKDNQCFIIRISPKKNKGVTVNPKLLTILDKVNKEYGPALKKLAQL